MIPRPRVTLKLATSLDGKIATAAGESKWITGEDARAAGHRLRATHDAVLVGIETALADDPELTVRTPGYDGPQPLRVVLDSRLRLPPSGKLAMSAGDIETQVFTLAPPSADLQAMGVRQFQVPAGEGGRPDLEAVLDHLAQAEVDSVLVEGGGQVAAAFLKAGLVQAIEWFRAPMLLGAEGRPAIGPLALESLGSAPRFVRVAVEALGADLRERYEAA
jgi:diaminohydroxyphosphoribosylaminopyrimidine deaminase/5-amino-6-(5-phosphoribosylamino)uracil reductase